MSPIPLATGMEPQELPIPAVAGERWDESQDPHDGGGIGAGDIIGGVAEIGHVMHVPRLLFEICQFLIGEFGRRAGGVGVEFAVDGGRPGPGGERSFVQTVADLDADRIA